MPGISSTRRNLVTIGLLAMLGAQSVTAAQHDHDEHQHGHGHNAEHGHDERVYAGFFEDDQIEDRALADWEGRWQSVYPHLMDGTLDQVFVHKASKGDKTAEEYKQYYEVGYRTEIDRLIIQDETLTLLAPDEAITAIYHYDGFEVLNYEAGNRGVRYIFERESGDATAPQYIQFSDHAIQPRDADHFHLYWGDDREALLEEVTNWPTYYPTDMSGDDIAHEMMLH